MTLEEMLISKTYYKTFVQDKNIEPVKELGLLFMEEQKKEIPDASYIRYSQGEVYFHYKDYESAIYKWNNVHNELAQWAKKNSADAYLELELFSTAEEIYKSIQTDSLILRTEILLQLFSLYKKQKQPLLADSVIKETVALNPDYPNVTKLALQFFEEREDWQSAIELAIFEGKRTELLHWFEILKGYIQRGYTRNLAPEYILEPLKLVYQLDPMLFEQTFRKLNESYSNGELFYDWVKAINQFFMELDFKTDYEWKELPYVFEKIYEELMAGRYSLNSLYEIIPNFLYVWVKSVEPENAILPSAATFAWNELAPMRFTPDAIKNAEWILFNLTYQENVEEKAQGLYTVVIDWASKQGLKVNEKMKFLCEEKINSTNVHVGIINLNKVKKSRFMKMLLNEKLTKETPSSAVTLFKHGDQWSIKEYKDKEMDNEFVKDQTDINRLYEVKLSKALMKKHSISFIEMPIKNVRESVNLDSDFRFSDSVLFMVNEKEQLTESEAEMVQYIRKNYPFLYIYFIYVDEANGNFFVSDTDRTETSNWVSFSNSDQGYEEFASYLTGLLKKRNDENIKLINYLRLIRNLTVNLLEQRVKLEKQLSGAVQQKADLLTRLKGAIHQLEDLQSEKVNMIRHSFFLVKEDIRKEMAEKIPKLLRQCSEYVTEERDFRKLHIELNEEMNQKLENYIKADIMPLFIKRVQEWLALCEVELNHGEKFLEEISRGINTLLEKEAVNLPCDYKIIEDWSRDIDRITSKVQFTKQNIMLRHTPAQALLKGAGIVLNAFQQNKGMLAKRYKQFIESENYEDVAAVAADKFFEPFALLDQGFERDVEIFFKEAFHILNELVAGMTMEAIELKEKHEALKENPDAIRDPLQIFQINIMQYIYLLEAKQPVIEIKQ